MREGPAHLCHHRRGFLEEAKYDVRTYSYHSYYDTLAHKTKPRRQPCSIKSSDITSLEAIVQQVLFQSSTGLSMTIRARSSRNPCAGHSSVPIVAPHSLTSCRYFISLQLEFERWSQIYPTVGILLHSNSGKA